MTAHTLRMISAPGSVHKLQECFRSRAQGPRVFKVACVLRVPKNTGRPSPRRSTQTEHCCARRERERERERHVGGYHHRLFFALMDCAPHALTAVFCLSTASRHNVNIISRSSGTPRDIFLLGVAVHLETSYSLAGWVMAKGEPLWSAFQLASACAQPQPVS